MADEITVVASIAVENGNFKLPTIGGDQVSVTQAAIGGGVPGTISIGTSEEDVDLSDLTTEGWLYMKNLDGTNYVEWGASTGGTSPSMVQIGRLEAGEPAAFRMSPGAVLRMKADTAACMVQIMAMED